VVGVITPWNWPYTMPAELIAPALASGNTVVWTPASTTAIAAIALAQCVVEADLPPGVFNLVTGPGSVVGDEIARNPGTHGVGFIGSVETGRHVAEAGGGRGAAGGRRRPPARRRCSSSAATARSSCWRTPTSISPPRRPGPPAFSAPGRDGPRAGRCAGHPTCAR